MEDHRFISSHLNERSEEQDQSLRPTTFAEFPGQEKIKERLQILVEASSERDDPLEHILLSGPPGLGKTTLAHIIANQRNKTLKATSGPVIEKPGDLAGLLTSLETGGILFIDEIHRLPTVIEEYLYNAMEDFVIDIMLDQGAGARSVRLTIPRFTLIGATTRQGRISAPLRSRFGMSCRLDYYDPSDLEKILWRSASILNIEAETEGIREIAQRSRRTPRIANNLLRWVRDYTQVRGDRTINQHYADEALHMVDIDETGLDEMDNRILETILYKFGGGPVGLKTVSVAVGEETGTIEDVYEPFLIQEGYVMRTLQGRVTTPKTAQRYGASDSAEATDQEQPRLF